MSNFYQVEIFNDQFDFVSATSVDISQNIELDYLTFNSYKITTLPIEVEKGCFIHITQENELVADGMVADVQPEDGLITITIRPLQALFDIDVYYSAVSDCITWIATNIGAQLATNADALQNRPIDITYTTASENLPLTGYNFNATVNILSVIGNALKTYGVVCDTYLDLVNKRIKCNIYANADAKTLEADLDNVLGKEVTIGDSYGAANKLTIQKIQAEDGVKTVLGDVTYYLHSDGTISDVNSDRITPVFYKLEQIELGSDETVAEWEAKAYAKAVEVLSPQKYDNEIVLSYHRDDKIAMPMEMTIGTATTIYVDGIAYSSILTGRSINGNVVTLTFGAVRTELTKKLILQKGNTGTITAVMNQISPQLSEIYRLIGSAGKVVYASPTELGLSVGCTIEEVLTTMPKGTLAVLTVNDLGAGEVPISYSTVFIAKNQNTRAVILAVSKDGRTIYSRNDESNTWTKVMLQNQTTFTPTRNTTNVTSTGAGLRFRKQGNLVIASFQVQLKAGLTNGNILYTDMPKPVDAAVMFTLNTSGGRGYRAGINSDGEVYCYGSFYSSQDWYAGSIVYFTSD